MLLNARLWIGMFNYLSPDISFHYAAYIHVYLDYFEVEEIMAEKMTSAGEMFQVKWKDGGLLEWVAKSDLSCGNLLLDFKVISNRQEYIMTRLKI